MHLPLGIQNFTELRRGAFPYADKTALIQALVHGAKYRLLYRPPRFGKSLLLSTLQAYFEGKEDLFEGLAIAATMSARRPRPVVRLSLSGHRYECQADADAAMASQLAPWQAMYGCERTDTRPETALVDILRRAHEATGRRVVVLIDDFDAPLLDAPSAEHAADIGRALAAYIRALKTADAHIRFAMLAGIGSVYDNACADALAYFDNISLAPRFDTLCGITFAELRSHFGQALRSYAAAASINEEDAISILAAAAGCYRFSAALRPVCNPDALLRTLLNGAPTTPPPAGAVAAEAQRLSANSYAVASLAGYQCDAADLAGATAAWPQSAATELLHLGVLTIADYDPTYRIYTLDYPNAATAAAFMKQLMAAFPRRLEAKPFDSAAFRRDVNEGRVEDFMARLKAFFDGFPYDHVVQLERHFHNVVYVLFKAIGADVQSEVRTARGRIDLLVQTPRFIYIMEFKLDHTPEEALGQVADREYAAQFAADPRTVVCLGISFSSRTRTLASWKAAPLTSPK